MKTRNRIECCMNCRDRHEACHDKCNRYLEEKAEFEHTKEKNLMEHGNFELYEIERSMKNLDKKDKLKGWKRR